MLRKWLCIPAALTCLFAQAVLARNIFVTSTDPANPVVTTVNAEPFSFGSNIGSIAGAFTVLPSLDSQKYYLVSHAATDTVATLEGRFPNLAIGKRIQTGGEAAAAAITPDGRRVVVVGRNGIAIINTETDTTVIQMGNLDVGSNPISVAVSLDSTRAYVVSADSRRLTAIDLTTNTVAGTLALAAAPNSVSVGRNGVVYVAAQNFVYEIDPRTLAIRASIALNSSPGELLFTADGRYILGRNLATFGTRGAVLIDLTSRQAVDSPDAGFTFTKLVLVDSRTAYGIAQQGGLYVLTIGSDGTLTQSASSITNSLPGPIADIVAGPELPGARYVILTSGTTMYRLETANNQLSEAVSLNYPGNLTLVSPGSTGVGGFLSFNPTQTVPAGGTSLPLAVQTYDPSGLPSSGNTVQFSTSAPGVTLSSASSVTNLNGVASTTVTLPSSATGTVSVNAVIAGGRTATFTITVGDPNLPGPGAGGGQGGPILTGLQAVAGNGQAISENFSTAFQEPLKVRLFDTAGNPVPNTPITWALVPGRANGSINPVNGGITDADGYSTANFTASGLPGSVTYFTNVIRASAPNGQETTFYVTSLRRLPESPGSITAQLVSPLEMVINARAGEVIPSAISVRVAANLDGTPIPYIGMRITSSNTDPLAGATAQCRGGFALSDQNGLVTCDLIAGPRTGSVQIAALVGSITTFNFALNVTVGTASQVRIIQGNNQSGNAGQQLTPLVVEVTDPGNNLLPNTQIDWEIPSNFGVVNIQRQTDANGRATATLSLPNAPGTFVVRARAGTGVATFNLTSNAVGGALTINGGDQQSALANQAFGQQISVKFVDTQSRPLPGVPVNFAVTSGSASLSSASAQTNNEGIAAVGVTAGGSLGPIVITANAGTASVRFNLAVRPPGPALDASSFLNAAGFQPGISPGSMAYIRVTGIASALRGSITPPTIVGPLPTKLADVEVLFNEVLAPIYAVSNVNNEESVVVQVPFETAPGTASVTVRSTGGGSTTVPNVPIQPIKPGVFTFADAGGRTYAVATRPDGSYVSSANPALRGEVVRIYATGLGQTMPATATNRVGLDNQSVAASVIVGINNAGVRLVSAETMPGAVGIYIVALEIPADTAAGPNQPVGLGIAKPDGQIEFSNGTFIPIQ